MTAPAIAPARSIFLVLDDDGITRIEAELFTKLLDRCLQGLARVVRGRNFQVSDSELVSGFLCVLEHLADEFFAPLEDSHMLIRIATEHVIAESPWAAARLHPGCGDDHPRKPLRTLLSCLTVAR